MRRILTIWVLLLIVAALVPMSKVTVVAEETVTVERSPTSASQRASREREQRRR